MARAMPVEFKMYFKVDFDTIIRGHHVYKSVWTPKTHEILECEKDTRAEAKEHDENAIGVYKPPTGTKQPNSKKTLAGHVPIELSRLLKNFLGANTENKLFAKATGKRKREIGLVVPAKFSAVTTELRIAEVLERELSSKAMKYSHFELNNIVIEKNKYPRLL